MTSTARIFVNYRTGDGEFAAALLHLHLVGVFGAGSTFLASQAIAAGHDFEREILDQLASCLAVIGPRWLEAACGWSCPRTGVAVSSSRRSTEASR